MIFRHSWHVLAQLLRGENSRRLQVKLLSWLAGSIDRSSRGNPKTIIHLSQATPRLHDPCFDSFSTNRHRGVALRNSDHFRSIKNRFLSVELLYSTFKALPSPRLNATQSLHKESDVSDLGRGLFDLARHSTPPQPA